MYMHSRQSCFSESPAAKEREKEHVDAHMLLLHPLIFLLPHMFTVLIVFPSPFSSFAHLFFHTHIYTFSHRVSFVTRASSSSHTRTAALHTTAALLAAATAPTTLTAATPPLLAFTRLALLVQFLAFLAPVDVLLIDVRLRITVIAILSLAAICLSAVSSALLSTARILLLDFE